MRQAKKFPFSYIGPGNLKTWMPGSISCILVHLFYSLGILAKRLGQISLSQLELQKMGAWIEVLSLKCPNCQQFKSRDTSWKKKSILHSSLSCYAFHHILQKSKSLWLTCFKNLCLARIEFDTSSFDMLKIVQIGYDKLESKQLKLIQIMSLLSGLQIL